MSGTGFTPQFLWVGELGYRHIASPYSSNYVRLRHFSREVGGWTSVDPSWPDEQPFAYSYGNPTTLVDPAGSSPLHLVACAGCAICIGAKFYECYKRCGDDLDCWYQCLTEGIPWYCGLACDVCIGAILKAIRCLRIAPKPKPTPKPTPRPTPNPKPKPKRCPPCVPAVCTFGYREETGNHYIKAKYGREGCCCGLHVHVYHMKQAPPPGCGCFFKKVREDCLALFLPFQPCKNCP